LSFGPIAASARPDIAATAAAPVRPRKSRRENPVIAALPLMLFCPAMMRWAQAFRKQRVSHAKPTVVPEIAEWAG